MKACALPYDMGNAGDLIKHGLLAEFTEWWLLNNNQSFVFLDPFGGRPFVEPAKTEVLRRVDQLERTALYRAQHNYSQRYYGSANLVRRLAKWHKFDCDIKVSDRDAAALQDMVDSGFEVIETPGFDRGDSFSLLDCELPGNFASLILFDSFDDFLPNYADIAVTKIANLVIDKNIPIAVFVLMSDQRQYDKKKWQELCDRNFSQRVTQFSIQCPSIKNTGVKGEATFDSEIRLLLPAIIRRNAIDALHKRLEVLTDYLNMVLISKVSYRFVSLE